MFGDPARQQLNFLLSHLPILWIEVDGSGKISVARGKGAQAWSLPVSQWIDKPFSVVSAQIPALAIAIERSLKGRTFQHTCLLPNGMTLQASLMANWKPSGQTDGCWIALMEQDGSSYTPSSLAQDHSLLAYFIGHAPAAIAMFDLDMHYLIVSDRWVQDYGLKENPSGRSHYEVFPEIPERWKKVHKRCMQGVIEYCEEDPFLRSDGHTDYIDWVVAPWYDEKGEVGGLIMYTQLVNERVEAKHKQLQLNNELTRSTQRMADFALAVSHTLQEPIRQAIQLGQQALTAQPQALSETNPGWINYLHRLEKIVHKLLEQAQLEGQMAYHEISMDEILSEVVANLKPLIASRPVNLLYGNLPTLFANEFEMVALMQQLLANAIEYNDSEIAEIIISVERKNAEWIFAVRDNGVGIPQEALPSLFHFDRNLDSKHPRGAGIGLPVCKRIIEHMGGKMWVESVLNQGSIFYFSVPMSLA